MPEGWRRAKYDTFPPLPLQFPAGDPAIADPHPRNTNPQPPIHDVWLNGRLLPADQAHVAVGDAGFQHAVGLFETFQVHHGRPFRLDRHLRRLADSARELGLADPLHPEPLAEGVRQLIDHNRLERARVRLTITAGTLSMLHASPGRDADLQVRRTVAIVSTPPTVYDPAYFERGITVLIHGPTANPFDETAGHKTLNYWARLRSLRRAAAAGAGETLWLNLTNHLAGGAVSNVFLVKDGELLTPIARGEEQPDALRAPVLPGITRAAIIELAEARGLTVHRRMLSVEELLSADEVFLTNSGWGVLPVTRVEKKEVSGGEVGKLTATLREALVELIEREATE